jgi:hypothetical protein
MTNTTITLDELEFAGAMKFRFGEVLEEDYDNGTGVPFTANTLNLNRLQHVVVSVQSGSLWANYEADNDVIKVYDSAGELADVSSVDLEIMAIGR